MIVSVHIPKTAGRSFETRLRATFGSRMLADYGDWIGLDMPEVVARRERRRIEARSSAADLARNYDIIHGHFAADKYVGLFANVGFAAFFRDPCQQAVSHYEFFARHPEIDHPAVKAFHAAPISLPDFISQYANIQSRHLGKVDVGDMAMVGLTEQYDRGIALFEAVFDLKLVPEVERVNTNPHRPQAGYPISPEVRRAVETHSAIDVDIYRRARERFDRLAARYSL